CARWNHGSFHIW
nr:immunoglobulin heavy chain junction region [Macaca mulatta]